MIVEGNEIDKSKNFLFLLNETKRSAENRYMKSKLYII
jgi:hypothetical protein